MEEINLDDEDVKAILRQHCISGIGDFVQILSLKHDKATVEKLLMNMAVSFCMIDKEPSECNAVYKESQDYMIEKMKERDEKQESLNKITEGLQKLFGVNEDE